MRADSPRPLSRRSALAGESPGSVTEAEIEPSPFGTLTMPEIAEQLIGEYGPMRIMEIVVRMKERGYRPQEPNATTYNVLRRSMTRISGRFVKELAGRWGVAGKS